MKHFVLTRSAYGPEWDIEANQRRLDVTRAVTARLMRRQTFRDWTWVVLFDERDPLLDARQQVFSAAAPTFLPILWRGPASRGSAHQRRQLVASTAYHAGWREAIGTGEAILQTRLDDDDGLAPDALERYQRAATRLEARTILMLPHGVRVWRGRYADVHHEHNAMHTLFTPHRDAGSVYDYGHATCGRAAPIVRVDDEWGWLWVRHQDTISGHKTADRPIDGRVEAAFPVDWRAL